MGLEGTLKVFSLTEIFQMLGLQRKTGILSVEGEDDAITISFLGGSVVAAESEVRRLDNRLGNLLLRAGYVTQEQLDHVLALQKETRQRMGFLLVREGLVEPAELREALRLQISRIVYSAFRWPDGRFHFTQEGTVDYDADHMAPVSTDTVLMEAAQIVDEWPLLEKKVGATTTIYRRAPGVEKLKLVANQKNPPEGTLSVSRPEAETWRWIDGRRSVGDIMERAFLSDFEVLKGTADLAGRNLIEIGRAPEEPVEVAPPPVARARSARASRSIGLWVALAILAALSAFLIPRNPANVFWRPAGEIREIADVAKSVSLNRAVSIERAVRIFYDSTGRYPRGLEDLVVAGIVDEDSLRDPYERFYRYILRAEDGKFGLYGRNARGQIDLDLSLERSLAPVSELRPAPSRQQEPAAEKPSVLVVE
ncbi:MAG TPA: DUF4388 domain-containing protein [Thermoanaerobaculia bacterium]|nr:DUF4388 domain-containing protein [Thermoanaerobaculia bacterium]